MSINRVTITGGLTREPELRATQSGTQILSLGVAVSERRKDPNTGEWKDYPNYVDCVVFGKRAEALSKILRKGSRVAIEGRLHWSQWEKDGSKRSKLEVFVDNVDFIGRKNDGEGSRKSQYSNEGHVQQGYNESEYTYSDDDIPF